MNSIICLKKKKTRDKKKKKTQTQTQKRAVDPNTHLIIKV